MSMSLLCHLECLLVFKVVVVFNVVVMASDFKLNILHVNDIHAHFDEIDEYGSTCQKPKSQQANKCLGGIARLAQAVHQITDESIQNGEHVIFLNAGDLFQGTIWYSQFKWQAMSHFANLLNFTAMALGNHEFDDKVGGLIPFLKKVKFPVIAANIDTMTADETKLKSLIQPSVVIQVGGRKIGIIGYITTETSKISNSGNVKFTDEIDAVNQEAHRLALNESVKILLALGHAGYEKDQEIAMKVLDIDAVIGGHSHSFLYSGNRPSVEEVIGDYPTMVKQASKRLVPVVQAYAFTKYLGHLKLTFSNKGELKSYSGSQPILLDDNFSKDENIVKELIPWRKKLLMDRDWEKQIGFTNVLLLQSRNEESNIGNFITDTMTNWYLQNSSNDGVSSIGIINSGGIRQSIKKGSITWVDLKTILPFGNTIDLVTLQGVHLRQLLEYGISKQNNGAFLQVSGLKLFIVKNSTSSKKAKLVRVQVLCAKCEFPKYFDLDDSKFYNVSLVSYIYEGGDGFDMIKPNAIYHKTGPLDADAVVFYLAQHPILNTKIEGRIRIMNEAEYKLFQDEISSGDLKMIMISLHSLFISTICVIIFNFV